MNNLAIAKDICFILDALKKHQVKVKTLSHSSGFAASVGVYPLKNISGIPPTHTHSWREKNWRIEKRKKYIPKTFQ